LRATASTTIIVGRISRFLDRKNLRPTGATIQLPARQITRQAHWIQRKFGREQDAENDPQDELSVEEENRSSKSGTEI
jgi:hypothetical protein